MDYAFLDDLSTGKSMVVSGNFLEADARLIELAIVTLFVIALAWGASSLFALALDVLLANARGPRQLRDALNRRGPLVPRFSKRRQGLLDTVNKLNDQLEEVQFNRANLQRKLKKLVSAKDQVVRQIGESTEGMSCHSFTVVNRYVLAYATKGQQHPQLDESWKSGQLVEVWAPSALEAHVAVVERYPSTFGFVVGKAGAEETEPTPQRVKKRVP